MSPRPSLWFPSSCQRRGHRTGALTGLLAALVVFQWRRGRLLRSPGLLRLSTWAVVLPLAANTAGWLFTETAQPFFARLGFRPVDRDTLSEEVRRSRQALSDYPATAVAMSADLGATP